MTQKKEGKCTQYKAYHEIFPEDKEEIMKARNELDQEIKERRGEIQKQESRIIQKEENLEKRADNFEKKEKQLEHEEQLLQEKESVVIEGLNRDEKVALTKPNSSMIKGERLLTETTSKQQVFLHIDRDFSKRVQYKQSMHAINNR